LTPDVLILDEVLAVGDANFRSKCWRRIGELLQNAAVILVSHEAYAISRVCDRAILLDKGEVKCDAPANETLSFYVISQPLEMQSGIRAIHESVKYFKLHPITNDLRPGDFLEFDLEINMKQAVKVDHAFVNINDPSDEVHAQSYLQFPSLGLSKGGNLFHIAIGPLFLSRGLFTAVIFISGFGGKVPIIHSRQELTFRFDNHINYGPKFYPPGLVKSCLI